MTITGRQIVTAAMQKARILTKHESPSADEVSDGLADLNRMIASWANHALLQYVRLSESFPISNSVASYTIGVGATFNTSRPIQIISAYTRVGGTDYPIRKILDARYDNSFVTKSTPGYPYELLYEADNPIGTITLFPVPIASGTIHIRSEKPYDAVTLDTDTDFPPGWEAALIFNLAKTIAPDYGMKLDQDTKDEAAQYKAAIKTAVSRNRQFDTPPLTGRVSTNVLSGPR